MEKLTRTERIFAAVYCVWFFLHLIIFFYADEGADTTTFWPFIGKGQSLYSTYDVFEFLIYTITPLLLYIVYKILFGWRSEEEKHHNSQKHSRHNFFIAFLDEKIKVEELTQKLNELKDLPVDYNHLSELKKDREKANTNGVNGWLDKLEVKKKYKDYERK